MRTRLFALGLLALAVPASSVRAADLDVYLPKDTGVYVHVNVRQLLSAPVVRKAIPMAADKYGDQLLLLMAIAKQLNAGGPEVSEEDMKKALNELKKPATIAQGFDAAKDFLTDIVVAGQPGEEEKFLILVKCIPIVTPEMVDAVSRIAESQPQVKLKRHKKGKATVYEMEMPPPHQGQAVFATVLEPGVVAFGLNKDMVEQAVGRTGKKSEVSEGLGKLIAKRADNDFVFVAANKGEGEGHESASGSLVLDKDVAVRFTVSYADAGKAKESAKEANETIGNLVEAATNAIGDRPELKAALEKLNAKVEGRTVSISWTLPGAVIEKLLSKDKE